MQAYKNGTQVFEEPSCFSLCSGDLSDFYRLQKLIDLISVNFYSKFLMSLFTCTISQR